MLYPWSRIIRSYIAASSSGEMSSRWRFSMIEISSAVSSSMSSTSAGIVGRPAICDARQRRSPAMSWNRFSSRGRTRMGWRTPCSRMLAASSWSVSSLNASRGCSGFDSMRSSGITLTPVERRVTSAERRLTIAGGSSRSSDSRRAAAARKSVLAKIDHLPGEGAIGSGRLGRRGVRGGRPADQRRLTELHGLPDDRAEDVVVADDAQLVDHVLCQVRARVVEGRQQAEYAQVVIQLQADRVDHLDQVVEAFHRVELGLD